jgi:outer membrane protein assembly factor BamB
MTDISRHRLLLLLSLTLVPAVRLTAADAPTASWPQFRGDAQQTGLASAALSENLEILWKFTTKDGIENAPAIAGDTVYIASMDEHVYAVNLADGKEKWHYKAAKSSSFKASPSVRGDAVYVGDTDGIFHCLDAATGKLRWKYETGGEIVSGANFTKDAVLFGSYADETLYCLSLDGKLLWKFKTGGPVNGSPAVAEGRTFVAGCDAILHVLDLSNGKEQAQVDLGGPAGASAAVIGEQLYVGNMNTQFLAVDWKKAKILWQFEAAKRAQAFYSSPSVTEQFVIAGSRDKCVHALERATGKEAWSFQTKGRVDGSPVIVGNRVFVGSLDGNLYVLDLAKGTELKQYKLGKSIPGSPAVAHDRLVIGTEDGVVYCLGTKK